jgi:hypothetical protein
MGSYIRFSVPTDFGNGHLFDVQFMKIENLSIKLYGVFDLTRTSSYKKCDYRLSGKNRQRNPAIPVELSTQSS